tara:strand:- start:261 stop:425 length:165 start_codon:yes stop_codon:yes gene_type:complete
MKSLIDKVTLLTGQLKNNKKVLEVYQARWVWYHTILAAELFVLIIIQLLILAKL